MMAALKAGWTRDIPRVYTRDCGRLSVHRNHYGSWLIYYDRVLQFPDAGPEPYLSGPLERAIKMAEKLFPRRQSVESENG